MDTDTPDDHLVLGGRPALTARFAVTRYRRLYNLGDRAARSAVARSGVAPIHPPPLHSRIPCYWMDELDAAMATRPGRGHSRDAEQEAMAA